MVSGELNHCTLNYCFELGGVSARLVLLKLQVANVKQKLVLDFLRRSENWMVFPIISCCLLITTISNLYCHDHDHDHDHDHHDHHQDHLDTTTLLLRPDSSHVSLVGLQRSSPHTLATKSTLAKKNALYQINVGKSSSTFSQTPKSWKTHLKPKLLVLSCWKLK